MSFLDVLQRIAAALERAGIPYMLTGSFACVFYGSPRSTQDIDLVIAASPAELRAFIQSLPDGEYYADLDAALEAHHHESLFNIIDMKTGWKIDMIICKARPFSQEEFGRRQPLNVEGNNLFVASAEDVILAKLEWSKLAQSQRQIEDVVAILRLRGDALDVRYVEKWVEELELRKQWGDARFAAGV